MTGYICEHCGKGINPEYDAYAVEIEIGRWKHLCKGTDNELDKFKSKDINGNRMLHYCGKCAEKFFAEWTGISEEIDLWEMILFLK